MIEGAIEHGLDAGYVERLRALPTTAAKPAGPAL
jgi:hypothetical protein